MCLYPKLMVNRRYVATKKNGGNVPYLDDMRKMYVSVGCGNCMECRRKKGAEWSVRLKEEIRGNKLKAYFMTYTFSDESIKEMMGVLEKKGCSYEGYKLDNEVCKVAVRRYLERWRKKHGRSLRHWLVTELGQTKTERIHMHGIVWTDKDKDDLDDIWKYGHADIGKKGVGEESCGYLVKYMSKVDPVHKEFKSRVFTSAGIGKGYLDRIDSGLNVFKGKDTNESYRDRKGFKYGMPMYYRMKLWEDGEREDLWMDKLDKEERWVDGIKVDVSTDRGMKSYENLRHEARNKNKRYGFGDSNIDWDKRNYENKLRNIKKETMLKKIRDESN